MLAASPRFELWAILCPMPLLAAMVTGVCVTPTSVTSGWLVGEAYTEAGEGRGWCNEFAQLTKVVVLGLAVAKVAAAQGDVVQ